MPAEVERLLKSNTASIPDILTPNFLVHVDSNLAPYYPNNNTVGPSTVVSFVIRQLKARLKFSNIFSSSEKHNRAQKYAASC